jgi:hypothetical protein
MLDERYGLAEALSSLNNLEKLRDRSKGMSFDANAGDITIQAELDGIYFSSFEKPSRSS